MTHELFLALRYLKPRRSAVSFITSVCIVGVSLGVWLLIVVMAVMTGFTNEMKAKLIETQAHFQVRRLHSAMDAADCAHVMQQISACQADAAPVLQGPVIVQFGPGNRRLDTQVVIFGAPEAALKERLNLAQHLKSGELKFGKQWPAREHFVVISTDMAERWNLQIGDKFLAHSATHLTKLVKFNASGKVELNRDSQAYLPTEFTVAGTYSLGKSDFDRLVMFASPDDTADLFDLPWGAATGIYGWGSDPFNQSVLLEKISEKLPGFHVAGWEEANRSFLEVLAMEKAMMFILLICIVVVAAFCIVITIIMSVYQKTREIGLLKALGCSDSSVMRIFVLQGFLLGAAGSAAGTVAGVLTVRFRQNILDLAGRITGQDVFPKQFYFFDSLPAQIVPQDVIFIILCSVVLCTAGALLPAFRAAKLQPAEALRYE